MAGGLARAFAGRFTAVQLASFAWGLLFGFFIVLDEVRAGAMLGLGRVVSGQLPEMVLRRAFLIVLTLGVILLYPSHKLTAADVMALYVLAAATALALGIWILWKARPAPLKSPAASVYEKRKWLAAVLPLALPAGMQLVNENIGILLLGAFSTAADVGIYKITLRGAMLVVFGLQAVNWVVAPHFARLHTAGDTARLKRLAIWSARASFAIGLPVVLVFTIWGGRTLALLFGPGFAPGYMALPIVAGGQLVSAAMGPLDFLLNMTGHELATARTAATALVCNVIFSFTLIPKLGINGAAVATALTLVVWNASLFRAVRRLLRINCFAFAKTNEQTNSPSRSDLPLKTQNP